MFGITHKRYIKLTGTYLTSIIAANLEGPSGLIHSDDSQIDRSSASSRDESRNYRERHPSGPPST